MNDLDIDKELLNTVKKFTDNKLEKNFNLRHSHLFALSEVKARFDRMPDNQKKAEFMIDQIGMVSILTTIQTLKIKRWYKFAMFGLGWLFGVAQFIILLLINEYLM